MFPGGIRGDTVKCSNCFGCEDYEVVLEMCCSGVFGVVGCIFGILLVFLLNGNPPLISAYPRHPRKI